MPCLVVKKEENVFPGFKKINIQIIPRGCMREAYREGWGDYWVDEKGTLQVRAVEFQELDHSFRVAVHELLEAWRCYRKGIKLEDIEAFDAAHEEEDDPGMLPDAPYHKEHMQSNLIEDIMLLQDGYTPEDYDDPAEPGGA
jgi:hypothetical protein